MWSTDIGKFEIQLMCNVRGEAWSAPDYYADGAQDPGRGRPYPLVPLNGVSFPLPRQQYIDCCAGRTVERPKRTI